MAENYLSLLAQSGIRNDTGLPVWIYKTEIPVVRDRRFFKIYLFNRYRSGGQINRVTFLHDGQEYPVSTFNIVSDYNDPDVVGCIFEIELTDPSEDLSIKEEILNGEIYTASGNLTDFELAETLPYEQLQYLSRKHPFAYYPQIRENWWQCTCGAVNDRGMTCRCTKTEEDMHLLLDFDFDENYLNDYLAAPVRFDPEKSFEDNLSAYTDDFAAMHPEIGAERLIERMDLEAEHGRYDAVVRGYEEQKQREEEAARLAAEKKAKRTRMIKRTVTAAVIVAALSFASVKWIIPEIRRMTAYNSAAKLLEEEKYDEAAKIFRELGNYKDSAEQESESIYRKANALYEAEDYDNAINEWNRVPEYSDSKERIEKAKEDRSEKIYQEGLAQFAEKKYEEAIATFSRAEVKNYKDAEDKYHESCYCYAEELFAAGNYEKAKKYYNQTGSYKKEDTAGKIKECSYQQGIQMLLQYKYTNAISQFELIKNYKDADTQLLNAKWGYISINKNAQDKTTFNYLKELIKEGYSGSQAVYNELYAWKLIVTSVNDSEYGTRNYTSLSRFDRVYFHVKMTGGPPDDSKTHVSYVLYWPDGSSKKNSFSFDMGDGTTSWVNCWYNNPAYGATGTLTVVFYDSGGKEIGRGSVYLTY